MCSSVFLHLKLHICKVGGWISKVPQVLQRDMSAESSKHLAVVVDLRELGTLTPAFFLQRLAAACKQQERSVNHHVLSCYMALLFTLDRV